MASDTKSNALGTSVFSQTMEDYNPIDSGELLSRSKFNLYMGLTLLWGFAINVIICLCFGDAVLAFASSHYMALIIGYIVLCIAGIIINTKSDNPAISFLGYNMVVMPLGAVLTVVVSFYPVLTVGAAFMATAAVTLVMVVVSSAKPEFFLKMGTTLFVALLVSILAEVVMMFMGMNLGIIDWVVALIFCGYIGYDWARAQQVPPTLDNAIDCACALYLDIVNLFIRLLEIFGNSKN